MIPGIGWGACFSEKITELAQSGKSYKATVLANKRLSVSACQLTLSISGTKITGSAKNSLCRAKPRSLVSVQVHTSCCDTPPCDTKNKIWFTQARHKSLAARKAPSPVMMAKPSAVMAKPPVVMAKPPVTAPANGGSSSQGSLSGLSMGSVTKSQPTSSKTLAIKNEAKVATSAPIAIGKGSATITKKAAPPKIDKPPMDTVAHTMSAPTDASQPLNAYKVELGVDGVMKRPGPPGELKVWIGDPQFSANFSADMATTETILPVTGNSAKVTPYAPDFDISPTESICFKVDPTGSETHFAITPKSTGRFKVGADVLLYASDSCSGLPVPKSAATLEVEVVVNKEGVAKGYLLQLWDVLWNGILNFWTWLVATIFGLFVFLIRKRLKKWFGFDAPDSGPADQ